MARGLPPPHLDAPAARPLGPPPGLAGQLGSAALACTCKAVIAQRGLPCSDPKGPPLLTLQLNIRKCDLLPSSHIPQCDDSDAAVSLPFSGSRGGAAVVGAALERKETAALCV